jgi:hypothetical protein
VSGALPAARILEALADAAERWCDADFPPRVRAVGAAMERTKYSEPVVDYAFDRLFEGMTRATLRAVIEDELGEVAALDGFVERPGRPPVHYRGVARATLVSSDSTLGVALPAFAFALCAKAGVTVKDRSDRLVAAFFETVLEERPELAQHARLESWSGHDDPDFRATLAQSDVVLAYGGPAALRAIREQLGPDARFVPFGHRTSVAYVDRATLDDPVAADSCARGLARDALLYDGEGCLSPHAAFVERGAALAPEAFAARLSRAFDAAAIEFPAAADVTTRFATYAASARFRATQADGALWQGEARPWLVVFEPARDSPPPLLPRTLALYAVDDPAEALAFIRAQRLLLEGFALAGDARADVLGAALASGATRLSAFGRLQAPQPAGEHGGEGRILPFVRAIVRDR